MDKSLNINVSLPATTADPFFKKLRKVNMTITTAIKFCIPLYVRAIEKNPTLITDQVLDLIKADVHSKKERQLKVHVSSSYMSLLNVIEPRSQLLYFDKVKLVYFTVLMFLKIDDSYAPVHPFNSRVHLSLDLFKPHEDISDRYGLREMIELSSVHYLTDDFYIPVFKQVTYPFGFDDDPGGIARRRSVTIRRGYRDLVLLFSSLKDDVLLRSRVTAEATNAFKNTFYDLYEAVKVKSNFERKGSPV